MIAAFLLPSVLRRIRNDVIREDIESFAARERAWNDLLTVFRDRNRLIVEYEASLVRVENLQFAHRRGGKSTP